MVSSSGVQLLAEREFLAPYLSPEAEATIREFKDAHGRWTAVYINNLVVIYNTRMVGAREVPRDYGDLLDPRWKGKLIMDSTDYDWFGTLVTVWGREKAVQYIERLARQEPRWRRGHGLVAQLVGAGEAPLGWAYSFRVERMKNEGAPVDWVETFDPIVTTINGVGLSGRTNHPNAGKLFIDFILSKRAQEMIQNMRRVPSRRDVKPSVPKIDQTKLKLRSIPAEVIINLDKYAAEFRRIFGL